VQMVGDEVFCWLANNDSQQRRPAATSSIAQHTMFLIRVSSSGACFASRTNTQMNVWSNTNKTLL
jgi:hypothetical protein